MILLLINLVKLTLEDRDCRCRRCQLAYLKDHTNGVIDLESNKTKKKYLTDSLKFFRRNHASIMRWPKWKRVLIGIPE